MTFLNNENIFSSLSTAIAYLDATPLKPAEPIVLLYTKDSKLYGLMAVGKTKGIGPDSYQLLAMDEEVKLLISKVGDHLGKLAGEDYGHIKSGGDLEIEDGIAKIKIGAIDGSTLAPIPGKNFLGNPNSADTAPSAVTPAQARAMLNVENGANNYVHPATHPASMIVQDGTHRFITDTERTRWNNTYTKQEVDNKVSQAVNGLTWKPSVPSFSDIATTYPNPAEGWVCSTEDTNIMYRYDDESKTWQSIGSTSTPMASATTDGLLSKEDFKKLQSIQENANNYVHPNYSTATNVWLSSIDALGHSKKLTPTGTISGMAKGTVTFNGANIDIKITEIDGSIR